MTWTETPENPVAGDLYLDASGDIVLTEDRVEEVDQRLRVRFQLYKGEWFADANAGTPWFQQILIKGAKDETIRAVLSQVIEGTPGISHLMSLDYVYDRQARTLEVAFEAAVDGGTIYRSSDFPPFVVTAAD